MKTAKRTKKLTLLAALGVLLQFALPQSSSAGSENSSLERLYWLCSDYQLPVEGFIVEGWFHLPERKNISQMLNEELGVTAGNRQQILQDGSRYHTSLMQQNGSRYLELQLITRQIETARFYEETWRRFAEKQQIQEPLGITILVPFDELLNDRAIEELAHELFYSLGTDVIQTNISENGYQLTGCASQLHQGLTIGGAHVNIQLVFQEQDGKTVLYIGSPVIYQQY